MTSRRLTISAQPPATLRGLAAFSTDFSWHHIFNAYGLEIDRIEAMLREIQSRHVGYAVPATAWFFTPLRPHLFRVFGETTFDSIKTVIIGMDPYPGYHADKTPVACGVAFMSEKSMPASLNNVFAELKRSIPDFVKPQTGDLRPWCRQGVLLLNVSLTHLSANDEGSRNNKTHKDVWLPLVYRILEAVTTTHKNLPICMWGREAQSYEKYISGTHLLLKCAHPSPLANRSPDPLVGSNHFIQINDHLVATGRTAVDWSLV